MRATLSARDVQVRYGGSCPVLEDLCFELDKGSVTLLLGPNASGKSSLLKAMAGILDYQGEIMLEGQELSSMSRASRARALAYVPQSTQLDAPLSVREVVGMARYAHKETRGQGDQAVAKALADAGCAELAERSFLTLSGGQRQQVLLARALATGAQLLLLDEPSSALDIQHTLALQAKLVQLAAQGYTVVWAMHDLHLAYQSDQSCLLLANHRLRLQGSLSEILASGVLEEVYQVQVTPKAGPRFSLMKGSKDAG